MVGKPGRKAVLGGLDQLRRELQADFVVLNAENAAGGLGLTGEIARDLLEAGADVLTTGNHLWAKPEFKQEISDLETVLIPANLPQQDNPGHRLYRSGGIAVFQLLGRLFMNPLVDDPFKTADRLLDQIDAPVILVDFHGEASSEKGALAHYLDGRVSGVFGTHTHVQTADQRVLPKGTGFITDAGMTGCHTGVIGVDPQRVINTFLTAGHARPKPAKGPVSLQGVLFEVELETGKCLKVSRVWKPVD